MALLLLRTFDVYADAEAARAALLDAGFPPAAARLDAREDEAGPVEGNFLVGNGRTDVDHPRQDPYDVNFARVALRSACLLLVEAADEDASRRAAEILARFNALDPEARTPRTR